MADALSQEFIIPTNSDVTKDPTRVVEKLVPYVDNYQLVKKVSDFNTGYLFERELTGETIPDVETLTREEIRGLHTYGGYYGFFRPDMWEVALLFTHTSAYKNLGRISKIYCTTEPWGGGEFSKVYDPSTDRHRGITTFLIMYKS